MTQKRILITGANKGIGLATVAAILEARDDSFVLLGSRSLDRGERAREELLAELPIFVWPDEVLPEE